MTGLRLVKRIKANWRRARSVALASNADIYVPAAFADRKGISGKLDQAGGLRGRWIELAEQAMLFLADSGAEVKRVDVATGPTVAESESPKLIDHDAVAALILNRAEKSSRVRSEGVNAGIALAKVADE